MFYSIFLLKIKVVWKQRISEWEGALDNIYPIWGHWSQRVCDLLKSPNPEMYKSTQEFPDTHSNTLHQPNCLNRLLLPSTDNNNLSCVCSPTFALCGKSLKRRDLNIRFSKNNSKSQLHLLLRNSKMEMGWGPSPFPHILSSMKDLSGHFKTAISMIFTLGIFLSCI